MHANAVEPGDGYTPRSPEQTLLHRVVREQLEPFLARARAREQPAPRFIEQELHAFLRCGIFAYGFLRLHCDDCGHDRLVPFSCKRRGFCPSCGGRRMADTAAHLVDRVLPAVPVRQWVLTLPYLLRGAVRTTQSSRAKCFARFSERSSRSGGAAFPGPAPTQPRRSGPSARRNVHRTRGQARPVGEEPLSALAPGFPSEHREEPAAQEPPQPPARLL